MNSKFFVENKSGRAVDSVTINFNGYKVHFTNLTPRSTVSREVPRDSASYGHDVHIYGHVVAGRQSFYSNDFVDDLGGTFNRVGIIILPDLKAQLVTQ